MIEHPKAVEIRRLLFAFKGEATISKMLRVGNKTVRKIRQTLTLPNCPCGRPAGHPSHCSARPHTLKHRQNMSKGMIGIPKNADAETLAFCRRQPLSVRKMYRASRKALANPEIRLDRRPHDDSAKENHDLHILPHYWPDPCQMLILRERWEEQKAA